MKLYVEIFRALFDKFVLKESSGVIVKKIAENNGIAYIKLAQILSTQNLGNLFTEEDRIILSSICDNCKPISFKYIKRILRKEYGRNFKKIFKSIDKNPLGSASVSQVHKAVLMNGDVVVLKVKRMDVASDIARDINDMRKFVRRYGKLFGFFNFKGADLVFNLYSSWILEEVNFDRERENIKKYLEYVKSVNGKVLGTYKLMVPKVYDDYSTSNVIVMEFVDAPTINKMELTPKNKQKIVNSINSYIKLNFWAMFNDKPICFHGDPHSGNLAINGDSLWFLDMGLLFILNKEEADLCRDFFLAIYSGNYEKLYNMLVIYGKLNDLQKVKFKEDVKQYVNSVRNKNVTHYFIDLIGICLNFEFVPPYYFVNMAKSFICIYGICNFSNNDVCARELLREQVFLFTLNKHINNFNEFSDFFIDLFKGKY